MGVKGRYVEKVLERSPLRRRVVQKPAYHGVPLHSMHSSAPQRTQPEAEPGSASFSPLHGLSRRECTNCNGIFTFSRSTCNRRYSQQQAQGNG